MKHSPGFKLHGLAWTLITLNAIIVLECARAEPSSTEEFSASIVSPWTWVCKNKICTKTDKASLQQGENGVSLSSCKLNCGAFGQLWPRPTGQVEIGQDTSTFSAERVIFKRFQTMSNDVKHSLQEATNIFKKYLKKMHLILTEDATLVDNRVAISIEVASNDKQITLTTDESYSLNVELGADQKTVEVKISANTYFGARHGLETLSQLIAFDKDQRKLIIVTQARIVDKPIFPYRGFMLDTSRNFYSVTSIKRIIDGMSYVKLNMFHWHITDTHSFPFYSKRQPKLTQYGAYSPAKIYTIRDMKDIVQYARVRGIKVVPEFDQPAHTGNGWQWGPSEGLGNLALCVNAEPWQSYCVEPPCGQLNVVNKNLLEILGDLYKDFLDIFDHDLFHMGGDEINFNCWNTSTEITDWFQSQNKELSKDNFVDLWGNFQDKVYAKLKEANKGNDISAILWTSDMTTEQYVEKYLDKNRYIIQIWSEATSPVSKLLIEKNYRVIFANYDALYLDCGYGGWVGAGPNNWCSPYKGWQQIYGNSPIKIYANFTSITAANQALLDRKLLGASAQLWSEQVDEHAAEGKIWPRLAAHAERVWTNPNESWSEAEYRMIQTNERLIQRGIQADRLQPEWCRQNEGHCYL